MNAVKRAETFGAPLDGYIKHAEKHGAELVFETAAGLCWPFRAELTDRELGRLAVELRAIDPEWRLPSAETGFEVRALDAADLALRLVGDGVLERAAARMAGISLRTLQRRQRPARELLEQLGQAAKLRSEPAFQSGGYATNRGSEWDSPHGPQLSLETAP